MLEIFLFYLQTSMVLVKTSGLSWPPAFSIGVQAVSAIGGFSLQALECVFDGITLAGMHAVYFLLPVLVLLGVVTVYYSGVLLMRVFPSYQLKKWPQRCIYVAVFLLQAMYFNLAVKVFDLLGCSVQGGPSEAPYFLTAFPWVACDPTSGPYPALLAMAIIALLVYVIGIPLMIAVLLHKYYRELENDLVVTMIGFLYACYRPRVWWWKFVILLRRVSLSILIGTIPFTSPNVAVWAVLVILQIAIFLQHALLPYRTKLENWMELCSLYILTISFLGAYVQSQSPKSDASYWILIALMVMLILFGVVLLAFTVITYAVVVGGRIHDWMPSAATARPVQMFRSTTIRLERALFDVQDKRMGPGIHHPDRAAQHGTSALQAHLLDDTNVST